MGYALKERQNESRPFREAQAAYNSNFTPENGVLSAKNTYFGSVNS